MLFLIAIYIVVIFRLLFFDMVSWDYENCISLWYQTLENEGFSAFSRSFSDYSPTYLYLIYILTFIPLPPLYSVKVLSVIFDILLSFFVSRVVYRLTSNAVLSKLSFLLVLSLPTVIMNSSYWAQSDSIYTTFVLVGVLLLIEKRYLLAYTSIGVAFAFKLQTVFIIPALAIITLNKLVHDKDMRFLFYPFLILIPYVIAIIPSLFAGRDLIDLVLIYFSQTQTYVDLTLGAPNIYTLIPESLKSEFNNTIFYIGLGVSFLITFLFVLYYFLNYSIYKEFWSEQILVLFLLFALIEPYLLPRMHDRYFYMADILSIVFAFRFGKWFLPVVVVLSSSLAYIQVNILLGLAMVAIPLGIIISWYVFYSAKILRVGFSK
ncbi:MAG: hypothetical protein N2712_00655 [Brevinematales bacterium]|nr:hypothetical protein [Brevinematales bacterium]